MYTLYFETLKSLLLSEDLPKIKEWITANGYIHFPTINDILQRVKDNEIVEYIRSLQK